MRFIAAAVTAVAVALFTVPAFAASCQFVLPDAVAQLEAQEIPFHVLGADQRAMFLSDLADAVAVKTGAVPDLSKVSDVLLAVLDDELFFGLVIEGCLTSPQPLAAYFSAGTLSGWTRMGIFA